MENNKEWFVKMISFPVGVFHLSGDNNWGALFISEKCMEVLGCSRLDFIENLLSIELLSMSEIPEKTVGMRMEKMKRMEGACAFVGVRKKEDGSKQYIRGNLESFPSPDGRCRIYGQIMDITPQPV